MRFVTLFIAAAFTVSPSHRATELTGPDSIIIGANGTSGGAGAAGYTASGFKGGPVVDVHTKASGVRVTSVVVTTAGKGCSTFCFTVEYDSSAPDSFELEVAVSSGTGWKSDGFEKMRVKVKRD